MLGSFINQISQHYQQNFYVSILQVTSAPPGNGKLFCFKSGMAGSQTAG